MTRVSVVTPMKNAGRHLRDAIASVTGQTEPDFELLLVDDGSTDDSLAIAETAAASDPRIRLLRKGAGDASGAAAARNRGIAAARGASVAFLDADDRLAPHMLATTLAAMDRHPDVGMVFGRTHWWYPDRPRRDWVESLYGRGGRVHAPPVLLAEIVLIQTGHVPCIGSILVRKSALDRVGGFEERFALYEDQTLWVKLFATTPVYVEPAILSHYRQHPHSTSAAAEASQAYSRTAPHSARLAFLDWVDDWLRAENRLTPALGRALRIARRPYAVAGEAGPFSDRIAIEIARWRMRVPQRIDNRWRRLLKRFGS
jgi:glycosyltransferase involved in cell wall biosynthesis